MAYTSSAFIAAQGIMDKRRTKEEMRSYLRAVNTLMLKNRDTLIANITPVVDSEGTQAQVDYFERNTNAVTHERSSTHTYDGGNSNSETLTFTPYVTGFSVSLKDNYHNNLGAEIMANEIFNACLTLHNDIETDSLAWLESYKSSINNYSGNYGTFDSTNHIFDIEGTDNNKLLFFDIISAMMKGNAYNNKLDLVYSSDVQVLLNKLRAQGVSNAVNTQYEFADFAFAAFANGFSLDSDEAAQFYAMPEGSVAMITKIPKLNSDGVKTQVADYFNIPDPFGSGMTFAVHKYDAKTDAGTYLQDVKEYYEISVDVARAKSPLSTSTETVIQKGSLLLSGGAV